MKKILLTTFAVFALNVQADLTMIDRNKSDKTSVSASTAVATGSFKSIIAKAKSGYKANLKANMAWRDTSKMIKTAKKLNKTGKSTAALSLAKKAYQQTVNAAAQAVLAESAGPIF